MPSSPWLSRLRLQPDLLARDPHRIEPQEETDFLRPDANDLGPILGAGSIAHHTGTMKRPYFFVM